MSALAPASDGLDYPMDPYAEVIPGLVPIAFASSRA